MAFNINPGKQQFSATASQTVFTFNFAIFADTDLNVYKTLAGAVANDTTDILILSTDYTVSINSTLGGTVTLLSGASLNDTITIVRSLPVTRTSDYVTNGDLYADTLDADQDYQTYLVLDGYTQLNRALIVPESLSGVSLNLPSPISNSYIRWNATADALENDITIPTAVTTSASNAAAAALSASNASTSEINSLSNLNDFKSRYYGALSSDPILDPLGAAITAGDLYWNTTSATFKVYNGTIWVTAPATAAQVTNSPSGNIASTDVQSAINELDSEKQTTLISGTNIKTINGSTLLGSGDLTVTGNVAGIRQTVQRGSIDANGYATFISIGTGLAVNIAATTTPLKIHAAGGDVSSDRLGTVSADTSIAGLTASSTNYLFAEVAVNGTVTLGKTVLKPVYQQGGTPSVTLNQYTFNFSEMKMYVGNGTTAAQVYGVFIGHAITNATNVTSVVNYALNGEFVTPTSALLVAATVTTLSHNLGMKGICVPILTCLTGQAGYTAGDELPFNVVNSAGALSSAWSYTDYSASYSTIAASLYLVTLGTASFTNITTTNFNVKFKVTRGW